jgi:hypothetical protein
VNRAACRLIACLAFCLACLAAGCEAPMPKQAEGCDIVRPRLHFAINVPQDWGVRDLFGDVVLEVTPRAKPAEKPASPAGEGKSPEAIAHERAAERTQPVVHVVVIDRQGVALDAWADQAVKDTREAQADLEVLSREPTKLADGREALLVVLKSPRGLHPILQHMLVTVTDTRAFALLATVPESDMATYEPALKKCFDSFIVW